MRGIVCTISGIVCRWCSIASKGYGKPGILQRSASMLNGVDGKASIMAVGCAAMPVCHFGNGDRICRSLGKGSGIEGEWLAAQDHFP